MFKPASECDNSKAVARITAARQALKNRTIEVSQRTDPSTPWVVVATASSASEAMTLCDRIWDAGMQAKASEVA